MSTCTNNIKDLKNICDNSTFDLLKISEEEYNYLTLETNDWSKKKTLAHLVNMAVFLHQRIVRSQFENSPEIIYDSENWLLYSNYEKMNSRKLILFWKNYNLFIANLVESLTEAELEKRCFLGVREPILIKDMFNDYLIELRSYINNIIEEVSQTKENYLVGVK